MSDELKALAGQAAVIDSELAEAIAPPPAPGAAVAVVDPANEAKELIAFAVELFTPIYPVIAGIYTPERQARLAAATVPLLDKYGFSLGGFFEKWGPEIGFAIVAGPMIRETVIAIKADSAAKKEAEKHAKEGQGNGGAA